MSEEPAEPPEKEPTPGQIRPMGPGPLVVSGLVALVVGWSVRPLSVHFGTVEPVVSRWAVAVVWLLALAVGLQAWQTWRSLQQHRGRRLLSHEAVNRLLLGKAAALVGALIMGGYAGTVLSHVGALTTELTDERLWRGGVASLGGLILLLAGLLLERACRVRGPDD